MQLPPTLQFVEETRTFGNFSIEFGADFWSSLIFRLFFGITTGALIDHARAVLANTVQTWFESWKRTQPNIRDAHVAFDGISVQRITTSTFFGLITSTKYRISTVNLHVTYERGQLVAQNALVRPAPISVDPPPFAFKLPATFTLEGIQGRVIVEGGDSFETSGDTLFVHNGAGLAASGLLTNREVPRRVEVGQDATGAPIFADDESGIVDRYVSLEGLGLNIPLEGFTGRDGVKTYGVLVKGVENMDLRLADEQPRPSPAAPISRNDSFTVALLDLHGSATRNDAPGTVTGDDLRHIALQIVLGDGNDTVYLKQTTGNVSVLGGGGDDTLVIADNNSSLGHIGGEIRYDGAAHINETTHQIASFAELGLPGPTSTASGAQTLGTTLALASTAAFATMGTFSVAGVAATCTYTGNNTTTNRLTGITGCSGAVANSAAVTGSPPLPLVFVNTANPSHSFLDAGGRTIRYADATLQPIVFAGSGGLRVNAVVLRSDGEIVTDLVREKGTHEQGVVEQGKQRWNSDDQPLFLTEDLR